MFRINCFRSAILLSTIVLVLLAACSNSRDSQTNSAASNSAGATPVTNNSSPSTANTPQTKVNINTATESQLLAAVPGLGNRMVHEFEEYRPYRSIQQFRREIGKYVSPDQVKEYEKYVFVPIDPNQSDSETLQQIAGLDASEADSLIAGRPYPSPQAFLAKLADKISAADLDVARTYLGIQ